MPLLPSPIQQIFDPLFEEKGVKVFVKREDLIHPLIMGNKWRKLNYNIKAACDEGYETIVTMGGAFSNHILATAAAAKEQNLRSIGLIRGEELSAKSNPTLKSASDLDMQLEFLTRANYKSFRNDPMRVQKKYSNAFFIPEGGTNALAIQGCAELVYEIDMEYQFICTSIGTGGTMSGLLKGIDSKKMVLGFSSLKGKFIHSTIENLLSEYQITNDSYQIFDKYHFGGYAKVTSELIDFIHSFRKKHEILLDPIYTGKMFYGVIDLIKQDFFKFNPKIVLLHSGGIQGIKGYNMMNRRKIS